VASPATRFKFQGIETRVGPVALVTMDNGEDWQKPNTFGEQALRSLDDALGQLSTRDWRGLVLTGKPFVFAVGADIDEFGEITPERARQGGEAGHELFGRLRDLPFVTLAAINGAAVGGGVEIALHCDYRTISSDVRHFACPEVLLGLIPGWGGTQLVPKLVGAERAVTFVVENPLRQNRMLNAQQAFEQGFADALLEPVEFLDESLAFLVAKVEEDAGKRVPAADLSDVAEVVRKARSRLDGQVHGATPAPYRALELIEGAATWSLEEGYRAEEDALAELLPGPQAQASIYAFNLIERRAKRGVGVPDAEPRRVQKVGIVGAGLMARQLALLFLRRLEVPIVIRDVKQEIVDEAVAHIGAEAKSPFLASIVSGTTGYEGFEDSDLVLEAVFEELDVKKRVFAQLEDVVRDDCVLATNTSALSITEMAAKLKHPDRVAGMHFFNPVALMPLLEVVRAEETSDEALATVWAVGEKLRKRPILVADAPGFVVNRVLTRMTRVIMDAIEHGTPVDEVDEAVMSLGMPMAPSVLLQMVGPGVANHVLERMHDAYPDRFPLSPALASIADGGEPVMLVDEPRTREQIVDDVLEAVADEIHRLLDEGVVTEAADVDTGLLLGAGWPFFLGGITKHLDQTGMSDRLFGHTFAEMKQAAPA
jgi:3-hydroxyacyl-CoA dehydrogenase/enoyl-CoA hydratase/carnithine racemase